MLRKLYVVLRLNLDIRTVPNRMMKAKPNAFDALNAGQRRAATFGTVVPEKGVSAGPPIGVMALTNRSVTALSSGIEDTITQAHGAIPSRCFQRHWYIE